MLDESVSSSWIWKKNEVIKPYNNYVKKKIKYMFILLEE